MYLAAYMATIVYLAAYTYAHAAELQRAAGVRQGLQSTDECEILGGFAG